MINTYFAPKCNSNLAPPAFTGRLVPAAVSHAYENIGYKCFLSPLMDFKARKYSGIRATLSGIMQKVNIPLKNGNIYAWELNPENSNKYVLFLHGIKGTSSAPPNQSLLESIIKRGGYGVITPEYRGMANLHNNKFTFNRSIEDAEATLQYLYNKGIKPEDITVLSHCIGSIPGAKLAAKEENLGKFIMVSPIVDGDGFGTSIFKTFGLKVPKFLEYGLNKLIEIFMPYDMNMTRNISKSKTPVTIVIPQKDKLVSVSQCKKLSSLVRNLNGFISLPKYSHSLTRDYCEKITELL